MRLLLLLFFILSTSCTTVSTTSKKPSKDGFIFEGKEVETLTPNVEFVIMRNQEEFNEVRKKFFGHHWHLVKAFTRCQ